MSRKTLFVMLFVSVLAAALTVSAAAQPPPASGPTRVFTGALADAGGKAVPDGAYDFLFTLYAAEKDGEPLWTETQTGVPVKAGSFTVALGQSTPLTRELAEGKGLWLAVSVRGPQDSVFTLLEPRQVLDATQGEVKALECPHNHFGDYWYGSASLTGLIVENTGSGDAIDAYSRSTVYNYAAIYAVNIATTGVGTAVFGSSVHGNGLYASSSSNDAIQAVTDADGKSAIYAHAVDSNGVWAVSTNRQGVHGGSTNNFGVVAAGGGDATYSDLIGDLLLGGNRGEIFATGDVLALYSNSFIAFDLDNDNNSATQFEIWNGADSLVFSLNEGGNLTISGNLNASGTKSGVVTTKDYGNRLLYAVESAEVWFEDLGTAQLTHGAVTVTFEPVFAETVDLSVDYHVYLTAVCEQPVVLYVSAKNAAGFTVQGVTMDNQPSACAFDYRVVAKRLGYADVRLTPADTKTPNSRSQAGN